MNALAMVMTCIALSVSVYMSVSPALLSSLTMIEHAYACSADADTRGYRYRMLPSVDMVNVFQLRLCDNDASREVTHTNHISTYCIWLLWLLDLLHAVGPVNGD